MALDCVCCRYNVSPGQALGTKSKLFPPPESPAIGQSCELLLEAIDKYGNKLDHGGSRVDARANGPGVSACLAEDRGDGTYVITFTAAVVGETRVIVRLDNVEMAPLKLLFVDNPHAHHKGKGSNDHPTKGEAPRDVSPKLEKMPAPLRRVGSAEDHGGPRRTPRASPRVQPTTTGPASPSSPGSPPPARPKKDRRPSLAHASSKVNVAAEVAPAAAEVPPTGASNRTRDQADARDSPE
jgi:hypothetical protein